MTSSERKFTPPIQERSARTLRRMVESTRAALESTPFDELTLGDITRRAGVTVGAFYQRFPSKDALLEYLEQEAYEEIRKDSADLFGLPPPQPPPTTRQLLQTFATGMAALYRQHRGILRELLQRSRSSRARQQRRMDLSTDVVAGAVDWILEHGGPLRHPEPRKALSVSLLFITSALRDVILFGETWASGASGSDVDELVHELVRAAEAYLGLPLDTT